MKLAELLEADKDIYSTMTAPNLYAAGMRKSFGFSEFDYEKALDALIEKDKDGCWIYDAGRFWKKFDYKKGLEALKNTEYYKMALRHWPKGIKQVDVLTKKIKEKSTKIKNKPLKLSKKA